MLSQGDLEGLFGRIILNQFRGRTLSVHDWQEMFPDMTGMTYHGANQVLHFGDMSIEVSPMASHEEIRLARQNPTVPTANTRVKMQKPWQGLAKNIGQLVHDAEIHASKINERVNAVRPRMETAVGKVNAVLDGHESDVKDVEDFANEMEMVTNGGPK